MDWLRSSAAEGTENLIPELPVCEPGLTRIAHSPFAIRRASCFTSVY